MKLRFLCMFCIAGFLLISCSASNKVRLGKYSCTAELDKAVELYKNGKYSRAIPVLEEAKMQCGGSQIIDSVLYYLGMCNMGQKKYFEARSTFQDLARDFPNSPFSEEAQFRIGLSVFQESKPYDRDQEETKDAVRLLRDFLAYYPNSVMADSAAKYLNEAMDKLAKKEFDNAFFYEKNKEPEAAVVYYKTFIGEYPDSKYTDQAQLNLCELLVKLDRKNEAKEILNKLENSDNSNTVTKAKQLLMRIK
ncbi:MAG TPA: outer membrane protein assembly factor BamD [Chitinispirillaceae bacterium]|nr:outer membrane protein assembly factor BamD [Chitinispirillaceae bacterium]